MADQPKRKNANSVVRNAERKNGKASKSTPTSYRPRGKAYRGSHTRGTNLTYLQKTLLGGGAMVVAKQMNKEMRLRHDKKGSNA